MKKLQKVLAISKQENEDFEGYTLYPENAIDDSEMNKRIKKHDPNLKITGQFRITLTRPRTFSPLTITRNDD